MVTEPDGASETSDRIKLEAAVDQAVVACDGDMRAAVRALVIVLDATEAELEALRGEVARIEAAVSGGYVRRALRRREPGEA